MALYNTQQHGTPGMSSVQIGIDEWPHNGQAANFTMIDRIITLAVTLHQTKGLEPTLSIDERPVMCKMVNKVCSPFLVHNRLSVSLHR